MEIQVLASSSAGNAYIVGDGVTKILIECGLPFRELQKRSGFTLSECSACLISHSHGDHAKSWKEVRNIMPVFMLYDTARELGAEWYQYRQINYLNSYRAGTFNIVPIPAKHDVSCAAYIIISDKTRETLLFATDYMYLEHSVTRATHAIIEVNYQQKYIDEAVNDGALDIAARRRVMKSHAELQTAIKVLRGLDNALLKEIYIAHLSDRHANEAEVKKEIQRAIGKPVYICNK